MAYSVKRSADLTGGSLLGLFVAAGLAAAFFIWLTSFVVMILVGIVHGYHDFIPAIGFWETVAWLGLVSIVGSVWHGVKLQVKD